MNQTLISLIGAAVLTCPSASASTVIFRVGGVIEEASANAQFLVGQPYVVETQWSLASEVVVGPGLLMLGCCTMKVGGLEYASNYLQVNADTSRAYFVPSEKQTSLAVPGFWASLDFRSQNDFVADVAHLPGSFQDWNLPAAEAFDFQFVSTTQNGSELTGFSAHSTHYTSLTLTTIPESACSSLLLFMTVSSVARRRRGIAQTL